MKNLYISEPVPKSNIKKEEKVGDCFFKSNEHVKHYYLVREDDVLHVKISDNDYCINQLFDNYITEHRAEFNETFKKTSRNDFNEALNTAIFEMNLFNEENKVNED